MFRIGEFSKIAQVSIRMLRYYDEQKLLIPSAVNSENGYRMYEAKQIEQLNRIVLLRDMGFGVKEIRAMLSDWNPDLLKSYLSEQLDKTQDAIRTEKNRLQQLQGFMRDLEKQQKQPDIQIVMKQLPAQQVVSIRRVMKDYYCERDLWMEMGETLKSIKNLETYPSFSIYHDLDYREQEVDIEVCIAMEQAILPAGAVISRQVDCVDCAACFMIYGSYSNISYAYKEFAFWLEQHSEYRMQGENRQICHIGGCHTDNPAEYITELQIPLICVSLSA